MGMCKLRISLYMEACEYELSMNSRIPICSSNKGKYDHITQHFCLTQYTKGQNFNDNKLM